MKPALFLFCIEMANWLIINDACFARENFAKNTVKNIPKVLWILKNVLPLHSLNETHGASVKKNAEIAQLVEHNLAQKNKGSNLGKASKTKGIA